VVPLSAPQAIDAQEAAPTSAVKNGGTLRELNRALYALFIPLPHA
jgi:hypothetical protein